MAIRGQEIVSLIKRQIEEFGSDLTLVDVGTVVQVGDGVASVQGLQELDPMNYWILVTIFLVLP